MLNKEKMNRHLMTLGITGARISWQDQGDTLKLDGTLGTLTGTVGDATSPASPAHRNVLYMSESGATSSCGGFAL